MMAMKNKLRNLKSEKYKLKTTRSRLNRETQNQITKNALQVRDMRRRYSER